MNTWRAPRWPAVETGNSTMMWQHNRSVTVSVRLRRDAYRNKINHSRRAREFSPHLDFLEDRKLLSGNVNVTRTPTSFTELSSPTVDAGDGTTTLWGEISAGSQVPTGIVSITLNGVTETAMIHPVTGDFSASFAIASLTSVGSPRAITYEYAGDADFTAASGTGSLTVDTVPLGVEGQTTYDSILGDVMTMNIWQGTHVSLLTPTSMTGLNPTVMATILATVDNAYEYYASATGGLPAPFPPNYYINGRDTIAIVPHTGGAGYSYLSTTGVEIETPYFNTLYDEVMNNDQYDQVVFYELGRNFWLYNSQLAGTSIGSNSFATGYAVLMRFLSLDSTGQAGGPFNSWTYNEFEQNVKNLVDEYVADPSLNFNNTLEIGQGVPNTQLGSTDLFASFMLRLGLDFGNSFFGSLWKEVAAEPAVTTDQGAIDNLFLAACHAADRDLSNLFVNTWRWPISAAAQWQAAALLSPSSVPIKPSISWTASPITYGTKLNATQLDATATYNGTPLAGTFEYAPASGALLDAGQSQTLTVSFKPDDPTDYATTIATTEINVLTAPLTVAVNTAKRSYGQTNPNFTVKYSGLADGEGPSVLAGALAFGTTAVPSSNVGDYAVEVTGLSSSNYAITYLPGILMIDPAILTYMARDKMKKYRAANPCLTFTESGFVLGQSAKTIVKGAPVLSTTAVRTSPVGKYAIVIKQGTLKRLNHNYAFNFVDGLLQVVATTS
jgi:hypothetical protein